MVADLVTGGEDRLDRMRVRLDRMAGDEERGQNATLGQDLENPLDAENRVFAARGRAWRGRAAWPDPDRECVEVKRQTNGGLGHCHANPLPISVGTDQWAGFSHGTGVWSAIDYP